jgi:tetratricopeptide (TPR) repeat protein
MKPKALLLLVIGLAAISVCCAGGPAPARAPEHARQGVYYGNQGADLFNKGCYARALDYFQEAHQRYTAADDLAGVAHSLTNIADLYYRMGDMPSALLVYDDAIAVYQNLEGDTGLVPVLSNKAATLIALGRMQEAAVLLDQADRLDPGNSQAALRLKTRALWHIQKKEYAAAERFLSQAEASDDEAPAAIRGGIYFARGHVALMENRMDPAKQALTQALEIDREAAAYFDIARDLEALGRCSVAQKDHVQAVDYFKRSAKIFALLRNRPKADETTAQLKQSAAQANMDIQATLHWITQWLEDGKGADLCD